MNTGTPTCSVNGSSVEIILPPPTKLALLTKMAENNFDESILHAVAKKFQPKLEALDQMLKASSDFGNYFENAFMTKVWHMPDSTCKVDYKSLNRDIELFLETGKGENRIFMQPDTMPTIGFSVYLKDSWD